jgi:hypothetical protein
MKAIIFAVLVLVLSPLALGQEPPPAELQRAPESLKFYARRYLVTVEPDYNLKEAYANSSFTLRLTVKTAKVAPTRIVTLATGKQKSFTENPPEENVKFLYAKLDEGKQGGDEPPLIEMTMYKEDDRDKENPDPIYFVTVYTLNVVVKPKAEPRPYSIKLSFRYLDDEPIEQYLNLNIGVKGKDTHLTIVKEDDEEHKPLLIYSGETNSYHLTLRNDFPRYEMNIQKITVESIPENLIKFKENALVSSPINLQPADQPKVEIRFDVEKMGFTNLVSGFGSSPKLKLTITYDDGFGRTAYFTDKREVDIKPRDRVLIIAMVIGVLVGGFIRYYLEYLARRRRITRSELFKFMFYTVVFGMVVTALALFGRIKVTAFDIAGSFDTPLAIFIIGLAGAVAGVQLFVSWYKSLKPRD